MILHKLMRPATALMERLRISHKFALIFFIIMTPLLVLSVIIVQERNSEIDFLENERMGLSYIEVIRTPIEYIQQHRGLMAAILSGEQGISDRADQVRNKVNQAFVELSRVDQELGDRFEAENRVTNILQDWENIESDLNNLSIQSSFNRHTDIISQLINLASHVADTSNITLDPHLDSYYLGDAVVNRLLNLTEIMGKSRAVGSSIAASGKLNQQQHIRLAVLATSMEQQNTSLNQGLDASFAVNQDLKQRLTGPVEQNAQAVERLATILTDELLEADVIQVDAENVFNAATDAINISFNLYDKLIPELNGLFVQRMEQATLVRNMVLAMVLIALVLVVYLFAGFYVSISSSITSISVLADQLGQGDTTARIEINQGHEIGRLQSAMQNMATQLHNIISEVISGVKTLASSSSELNSISEGMIKHSESTASRSNTVATASEEMSTNMNSVASAMEQAATNVNTVATASEEMSATISEIAENTEKAQDITSNAVKKSRQSSQRVEELGKAASEISKVTETITAISSQTNLLALNATIEAARAGEAGKGFAVVANEIKELAQQTAGATDEIRGKIEGIQEATEMTVSEIQEINSIISDIDSIISTIAAAVEEQSVTTRDIAENISQASTGIQEVNENVAQSSQVSGEIARDISRVNESAGTIKSDSDILNQRAVELAELAQKLKKSSDRFKV